MRSGVIDLAEAGRILGLLIATRLALMVVGAVAMALLPMWWRHLDLLPGLLSMWAQYDAEHYVTIAVDGYAPPEQPHSNVAFFPLYPLLIRIGSMLLGGVSEGNAALAGLLISNAALFGALLYLAALVARDLSLSVARRSVLYVLVVPTTMFLSSVLAEAVFLLFAVASLYHARQGDWLASGLYGGLAALTRPFGILLLVPVLVELYGQRAPLRAWTSAALVPAGLLAYVGYLWWLFDDPLAYLRAGASWGRGLHPPWEALLGYLRGPMALFDWPYAWIDLVSIAILAALAVLAWRVLPRSYAAYGTAGVLFAMSTGVAWFSAARHALGLFPLLIVPAVLGEDRRFNAAWLLLSISLAIVFMARVAVGYWVA